MSSTRTELALALFLVAGACTQAPEAAPEFDFTNPLYPVPIGDGKADGPGQPAIRVDEDVSDTQVWSVRNQWTDTVETADALAAGLAWPASSGLDWDEKYAAWVASMPKTGAAGGGDTLTYRVTTPYGKVVDAPSLECAETAMFLRALFASWYGLPFFMEARDAGGGRVFFGHFGVRTASGRWAGSPAYPRYADYTSSWQAGQAWPSDASLRAVHLDAQVAAGDTDPQEMLGPNQHMGAYLDEVLLNKRAGYFIAYLLDYFYSGSLADPVNTYNLAPAAFRAGDVLIRRWQTAGIGHVFVIKVRTVATDGRPMAETIAGSMPRHQGEWSDEQEGKTALTMIDTGGDGSTMDKTPIPYWKLGGGLKRWRVALPVGGAWTNTYMPADRASWIDSNDGPTLSARPGQLESLLGELSPPEKRDSLLKTIAQARTNLGNNPSSCESRNIRENAFGKLHAMAIDLQTDADTMDRQYRKLDDYVFQNLEYDKAKTCCWDTSSPSMFRVVMDYAAEEQATAQQQAMCVAPTVFRAHPEVPAGYSGKVDGFQLWRDWAAKKGRSGEWIDSRGQPAAWSEDELCSGAASTDDQTLWQDGLGYCELSKPPPDPIGGT